MWVLRVHFEHEMSVGTWPFLLGSDSVAVVIAISFFIRRHLWWGVEEHILVLCVVRDVKLGASSP